MLSLFSSPRRALIVAHDLLMTAVAVVASCYIRFEAVGVEERLDTLFTFLPAFVVFMPASSISCSTSTKRSGGSLRCRT
jgi:hypothetical protein